MTSNPFLVFGVVTMARSAEPTDKTRPLPPASEAGPGWDQLLPRALGVGAVVLVVGLGALMLKSRPGNAEPPGSGFAADRDLPTPVAIDRKRVMGYLEDVCNIGTRISGSEGMRKQQELLEKHFTDLGGKITWQKFTARQRSRRAPVEMANLVVSYFPDRTKRIILCTHYDTRPQADQEANPRSWREPFISANDGGSGVALLMELAHHLKDLKTEVGVDLVFFDGEEYVWEREDDYFFGSKQFVREYAKVRRKTTYRSAILLDMIAGKTVRFPRERNSVEQAEGLVNEVWGVAADLECHAFAPGLSRAAIEDDHVPLNRGGIPAIDVIDFDYPHWHRLTDKPRNCSPEGMDQVARVLSVWLQKIK